MNFRKFRKSDIRQVAKIKNSVFSNFNKLGYFEKCAISRYLNKTSLKKSDQELIDVFKISDKSIFYVAEKNNKILGYINGKRNKIVNLFVLGEMHKKGIGRKLINLFENESRKQKSNEIKIASSIYAVPFYQKMGYIKTTGIRNWHGLKVQPMKKFLN
ncbi:MAG: GNAT family N-acetyltransferase [Nanoarchaeota archaeon]|nr:GNAT family N-acetyltransferase [Nanoarchaeota archaeon]